MSRSALLSPAPPWFFRLPASKSAVTDFLWSLQRQELPRGVVRWLRGKQMPTTEAMFNEFGAALQFPYYFGGNWAAFDECLRAVSWLPTVGYVLTLFDCADLLANEKHQQLDLLLDLLESVCVEWSKPVASGQPWDRPSVPFHVLFQYAPEDGAGFTNG